MIYLAGLPPKELVSTSRLSRELRVSRVFLAKIFQHLTAAGMIVSVKGKRGGIRLKNSQVSLAGVIRLIDPGLALNKCLGKGFNCFRQKECRLHKYLGRLQKELFARLSGMTLAELAEKGGPI